MTRALVTGGSGALGAAIATRLAHAGLHVIVHAFQNLDRAQQICESITDAGGSAEAVSFDTTDQSATNKVLDQLLSDGAIQVLINNAGGHDDVPFAGMSDAQWKGIIDLNLHGFYHVTRPLIMPMMRTRWGRIINISSVAAERGNRGQVNYSAAKAALHGATRSLALEVASRGITVNAITPGIIQSDLSAGSFDDEQIKQLVPMQRAGTAAEVASLAGYLASPDAAYISGQIIGINGAMA